MGMPGVLGAVRSNGKTQMNDRKAWVVFFWYVLALVVIIGGGWAVVHIK